MGAIDCACEKLLLSIFGTIICCQFVLCLCHFDNHVTYWVPKTVVKWENEQATVKLLDDVSSGEVEDEEIEEPEGDENVCDETKSILDSSALESKSLVESKSNSRLCNESKDILESTEQASDNEDEIKELESDNKEE